MTIPSLRPLALAAKKAYEDILESKKASASYLEKVTASFASSLGFQGASDDKTGFTGLCEMKEETSDEQNTVLFQRIRFIKKSKDDSQYTSLITILDKCSDLVMPPYNTSLTSTMAQLSPCIENVRPFLKENHPFLVEFETFFTQMEAYSSERQLAEKNGELKRKERELTEARERIQTLEAQLRQAPAAVAGVQTKINFLGKRLQPNQATQDDSSSIIPPKVGFDALKRHKSA